MIKRTMISVLKYLFASDGVAINKPTVIWNVRCLLVLEAVYRRCSVKKGVPRNFAKFPGKHLCQRLFFNKVAGLRLSNEFYKISKNTFFIEPLRWLLLFVVNCEKVPSQTFGQALNEYLWMCIAGFNYVTNVISDKKSWSW